jgi:hypothetical protein
MHFLHLFFLICHMLAARSPKLVFWSLVVEIDWQLETCWNYQNKPHDADIPTTHFLFSTDLLIVSKPHFAKQFWITAGIVESHSTATLHMASKMFHFLTSAAGTFLLSSYNNKHTRCFRYMFHLADYIQVKWLHVTGCVWQQYNSHTCFIVESGTLIWC